jgi:hypothetical protein
VAALLEPFADEARTDAAWRQRFTWLMSWYDPARGDGLFDLFIRLLDEGVLDEARGPVAVNSDFFSLLYRISRSDQAKAAVAIGHYLRRRAAISNQAGEANPFDAANGTLPSYSHSGLSFHEVADSAPFVFLDEVLPFLIDVVMRTASARDRLPYVDATWGYRGLGIGVDEDILSALAHAMRKAAVLDLDRFGQYVTTLRESGPYATTHYLIVEGFKGNPVELADEAAAYLLQSPWRFKVAHVNSPYWATRELLEAISPHCCSEVFEKLESTILAFYPDWERSAGGRREFGHAQYVLLGGLDGNRISATAARKLAEWERKFGAQSASAPVLPEVMRVPSPIPELSASHMTDQQWLGAIAEHDSDEGKGFLEGGAREFAPLLEEATRREPERFANLLLSLPDDTHPAYLEAILRGLSEEMIPDELLIRVCQRCSGWPSRPVNLDLCRLIREFGSRRSVPHALAAILAECLVNDPDPRCELGREGSESGRPYFGGDVLTSGLNSVRGAAADAVARLIFQEEARGDYFSSSLRRAASDPSTAVRSWVAFALIALLKNHRVLALELFTSLCETDDEVLLSTRYVYDFMRYALNTDLTAILPMFERMVDSADPEVSRAGAQLACMAALDHEEAGGLARRCVQGSPVLREGAATVFAANFVSARYGPRCVEALGRFFNDESESVREAAAGAFDRLGPDEVQRFPELVRDFVESKAFDSAYDRLLRALERSTGGHVDETISACRRFFAVAGVAAGDISTRAAADAAIVTELVIRVYAEAGGDREQEQRCLDLVDEMVRTRATGFDKALAEFDR